MRKNKNNFHELMKKIHLLDQLLEEILSLQFGIKDKQWINGMAKIEEGFGELLNCDHFRLIKPIPQEKLDSKQAVDTMWESA